VRVVVVTGAGKHFSAGADLNYMKSMRGAAHEANVADALRTQRLFAGLADLPKPVVARVHGAARGGGVGLVAAADVVVASNSATFAFTEVRLGIIPAMISPFVVERLGPARARRLFLTAETFDAEQGEAWGLVDTPCPMRTSTPRSSRLRGPRPRRTRGPRRDEEARACAPRDAGGRVARSRRLDRAACAPGRRGWRA
jgi:methylglutaconyl-CoA hydratase